jgi:uncharacterized membrane protein
MTRWRPLGLVLLAVLGAGISCALAAFQLGLVPGVWDPLFGDGSRRVLTSAISRALPIPDALVGAAAYVVDALLGIALLVRLGPTATVAAVLAIVSVMGAVVGLLLAVSQPLIAHAGCTLCLCSTAVSVLLAIGAVAEARERWPSTRLRSAAGVPGLSADPASLPGRESHR